jgi:DNA-binding GntR family transcriptional regulator
MPDVHDQMSDVQRLTPSLTLATQGADALRDMILGGVLRPGDRLNEVELSAALGISRAPLREAIRHLASQGLLTIVTHKGAFVPRYTAEDLQGIYEVRIALETHAARLFAERHSAEDLAELKKVLDEAGEAIEHSGSPVYPNDLDFHRALIRLTGNRHLNEVATAIDQKLQLARARSGHLPERAQEALAEHRQILRSLTRQDGDRAVELMRRHLRRSLANVLRLSGGEDAESPTGRLGPAG